MLLRLTVAVVLGGLVYSSTTFLVSVAECGPTPALFYAYSRPAISWHADQVMPGKYGAGTATSHIPLCAQDVIARTTTANVNAHPHRQIGFRATFTFAENAPTQI